MDGIHVGFLMVQEGLGMKTRKRMKGRGKSVQKSNAGGMIVDLD